MTLPLSETDTPEVEKRRFENLHTEEGAHLDTHTDVEKARGCITTRTVTASTVLTDYINWPGIAQVYRYQTHRENTKTGEVNGYTKIAETLRLFASETKLAVNLIL